MNFNLAELARRLENIVRFGTIAEVKHDKPARVRVKTGKLVTDWRPFMAMRAGEDAEWWPPSVGEQCLLFSPSGDLAASVALPGIYCDANPAPDDNPHTRTISYSDSALVQYNKETHAYTVEVPAGGTIAFRIGRTTLELRADGTTLTTPHFAGVQS